MTVSSSPTPSSRQGSDAHAQSEHRPIGLHDLADLPGPLRYTSGPPGSRGLTAASVNGDRNRRPAASSVDGKGSRDESG